jgi:hypothetical protein
MKTIKQHLTFWTPRVLCLLFAGFISLFALDVFGEHRGFWDTARALLIHLIPTGILLVILLVSWRWEWIGALVFPGLGAFYLIAFWGRFHWSAYALISGPLFLLGILFLMSWRDRAAAHG